MISRCVRASHSAKLNLTVNSTFLIQSSSFQHALCKIMLISCCGQLRLFLCPQEETNWNPRLKWKMFLYTHFLIQIGVFLYKSLAWCCFNQPGVTRHRQAPLLKIHVLLSWCFLLLCPCSLRHFFQAGIVAPNSNLIIVEKLWLISLAWLRFVCRWISTACSCFNLFHEFRSLTLTKSSIFTNSNVTITDQWLLCLHVFLLLLQYHSMSLCLSDPLHHHNFHKFWSTTCWFYSTISIVFSGTKFNYDTLSNWCPLA